MRERLPGRCGRTRGWREAAVGFMVAAACGLVPSPLAAQDSASAMGRDSLHPQVRALIVARDRAVLSSELAARIAEMPVRPGEAFKKGDPLVRFDCSLYQAQRAVAVAEREAAVLQQKSTQRLFDLHSVGALDVALAENAVEKADATVRLADISVARCVLRAPFAGRVVLWKANPHETVAAGMETLEIVANEPLEVEAIVPSASIAWLATGTRFTVTVDETGRDYAASVIQIGAVVDPAGRTVRLRAALHSASGLLPGMSGTARFEIPDRRP